MGDDLFFDEIGRGDIAPDGGMDEVFPEGHGRSVIGLYGEAEHLCQLLGLALGRHQDGVGRRG